jgi:hypothetical protein
MDVNLREMGHFGYEVDYFVEIRRRIRRAVSGTDSVVKFQEKFNSQAREEVSPTIVTMMISTALAEVITSEIDYTT